MKLAKSLLLATFTWLATAPGFAASVVYNYTGNQYGSTSDGTTDSIVYTTLMSITGTVELAAALTDGTTQTVTPTSFSFFDGNQTLTQADVDSATFTFTTDNAGDIFNWYVFLTVDLTVDLPASPVVGDKARSIQTQNDTSLVTDIGQIATVESVLGPPINTYASTTDLGQVSNNPGAWKEVTAVPLPATVWLFGSGLVGLVAVARRRLG